jgi:sugar diacid utilization regulator
MVDNNDASSCPGAEAALALQAELARLMADGQDIHSLLAALGRAIPCGVVLEDPSLTSFDANLEEAADRERLAPFASVKTSQAFRTASDIMLRAGTPLIVADDYKGLAIHRLIVTVTAGGERLGLLSLLRTDRPFDDDAAAVLGHAAGLVAVHLAQQKRTAEIELRLKGNFVDDLVSLRYSDQESIAGRARALDFSLSLPHRVLIGDIENLGQIAAHLKNDAKALAKFWTELVGRIQSRLDGAGGGMVIHKNDEIILLARQDQRDSSADPARRLAGEIIDDVAALFRAKLYIGIGRVCLSPGDYQESYLEAKKALEIGAYMITEGQVRSFEQFRIHALFLSTLKPAELYGYARSQLGALLDHDAHHQTELLKTLQEFLYLRNNVEKTAKSLSMSVSGLKYRLAKIEKILGLDLGDYKVSFDLQLALIILQIFGEYRIRNLP